MYGCCGLSLRGRQTKRFSHQDKTFTTAIWCTSGHIFSLVTRPSIKHYAFVEITQIHSLRLVEDPSAQKSTSNQGQHALPAIYYDHLQKSDAGEINGWSLLAPEETYVVSLPEGDYVVLAIRGGQEYLLALVDAPGDQRIYHMKDFLRYPGSGPLDEIMRST